MVDRNREKKKKESMEIRSQPDENTNPNPTRKRRRGKEKEERKNVSGCSDPNKKVRNARLTTKQRREILEEKERKLTTANQSLRLAYARMEGKLDALQSMHEYLLAEVNSSNQE